MDAGGNVDGIASGAWVLSRHSKWGSPMNPLRHIFLSMNVVHINQRVEASSSRNSAMQRPRSIERCMPAIMLSRK
ncbi:hypothetical protein BDA96_03G198900 [Sorghum bicolor]|uniref:Uncharacterized protein n=1 Tax=Sorghum bicolor TaxID=4558 RepID=A0A921RDT2_SORBI|nr:hypothetical protein BDA96_03G198900 [Sorghum bicolor]